MVIRKSSILCMSIVLLTCATIFSQGNGMNGDTSEIMGTVQSVNIQDSMFVISTEDAEDTIYYNSETEFSTESADQLLQLNTRIRVMYKTEEDKKVATRIEPATANGETPQQEDTSAVPPSPEGEEGAPPIPDEETPPFE